MDRLKEERDTLQQDKDKVRRMAETEIERLKEELQQQKDRDNRLQSQQDNHRLKEKLEDFDKLYQEHKELEKEYDQLREKLKEARAEVREKSEH